MRICDLVDKDLKACKLNTFEIARKHGVGEEQVQRRKYRLKGKGVKVKDENSVEEKKRIHEQRINAYKNQFVPED